MVLTLILYTLYIILYCFQVVSVEVRFANARKNAKTSQDGLDQESENLVSCVLYFILILYTYTLNLMAFILYTLYLILYTYTIYFILYTYTLYLYFILYTYTCQP